MSHLTTCEDSLSATFSPELASGRIPCGSPDGLTINQSGPAPAPASHSASQENAGDSVTPATCGPHGASSLRSAHLTLSLVNRLQARTASHGSTLNNLTWKKRDTPSQLSIFALRASVRRTSGNASSGWPTPTANAWKHPSNAGREGGLNLQTAVALSGWPTPTTTAGKGGYQGGRIRNGKLSTDRLDVAAQIAGWPTPTTSNDRSPRPQEAMKTYRDNGTKIQKRLQDLAAIATPARLTASGEMLTGCSPGMESGVQLMGRVEPGVARVASSNRVGRLKGYGNAINAQAAAEFIRAYMGVSYGR